MPELSEKQAYAGLTPDHILDAVESVGLLCDGRFLALNSYENRVYRIGLEDGEPVVGKFYRPQRWSDEAILEEHSFTQELADAEIPVVPPLAFDDNTLLKHELFRFALFPNRGGRPPELDNPDHLEQLGRFVGRIHAVGASKPFQHRPPLDVQGFAIGPSQWLLENDFIPNHLVEAYASLTRDLIEQIGHCYQRAGEVNTIRLHGDLHPGNILWTEQGPHIVDFDDARSGPAVQDLWMFLSGD
ncbi:MAG: serine/threonine protein kinase, partial [Gammaproteobacteria bacterium]